MCKDCKVPDLSRHGGCLECTWKCKCNYACYQCELARGVGCRHYYECMTPFRRRFVCFHCNKIWKNKYTRDRNYTVEPPETAIQDIGTVGRCSKGHPGIEVGPTFTHCKSKKEWANLKKAVQDGKVDMWYDFQLVCKPTRKPVNPTDYWKQDANNVRLVIKNKSKMISDNR
jgi:hypothetical protein